MIYQINLNNMFTIKQVVIAIISYELFDQLNTLIINTINK